jgi:1L-myo-inositol 1-phosphate cytidylyltransferase / CDP-L-myo-inositol myo-inositolphosphotransferase
MESEKSAPEVAFEAGEADRRVAGVAAAARIARDLAGRGMTAITIAVPEGRLAPETLDDLRRLCPGTAIGVTARRSETAMAAPALDERAILRATAKPSDGPVSQHFNRPISRLISGQLLRYPVLRPVHATIGTAVLAVAMFVALIFGGATGLLAGGLLFHAASVFDGVDGEMARATFRTSRPGAFLDSVIDMATNVAFVVGATVNLSARNPQALTVGGWGLLVFLLGLGAVSATAARADRPFSMDLVKERYRSRFRGSAADRVTIFLTVVTSRDFFAFLFALLIIAGRPMAVLHIFATAATVWILFVAGALIVPLRAPSPEGNA